MLFRSGADAAGRKPWPPRLAALAREAWWLVLVLVALYLALVLVTYDKLDPGWSHSTASGEVHNAGGHFGAWMADVLLYLLRLCDKLGIDLRAATERKLALNEQKYPVEKARGRSTKYDKL